MYNNNKKIQAQGTDTFSLVHFPIFMNSQCHIFQGKRKTKKNSISKTELGMKSNYSCMQYSMITIKTMYGDSSAGEKYRPTNRM